MQVTARAGIPDTHYERWEYNAEFPLGRKVENHLPGEFSAMNDYESRIQDYYEPGEKKGVVGGTHLGGPPVLNGTGDFFMAAKSFRHVDSLSPPQKRLPSPFLARFGL